MIRKSSATSVCPRYFSSFVLLLSILLGGFSLPSASAVTLVFFDQDGYGSTNPRGLYNFDTETTTVSLRATVPGEERFFAMDIRKSDNTVFAVDLDGGLWTMDIDTGVPTPIGDTGISSLTNMAIHPTTDQIFAMDASNPGGNFYSINPATGASTYIGYNDVDGGMAFSPDGTLYGFDGDLMHVINMVNGASARVVIPSFTTPVNVIVDGTFSADGRYFVTDYWGRIVESDPIDSSGTVLVDGLFGGGMLGLVAVPEPSALALAAFGLFGLFAFVRRRRT